MAADERQVLNAHGAKRLPSVEVDSYNLEIKDEDGFVGDKANRGAFHEMLEKWREPLRKLGADPLGEKSSDQMPKKQLDKVAGGRRRRGRGSSSTAQLKNSPRFNVGDPRFVKASSWKDTERIVVGGGCDRSRIGELAIGRTAVHSESRAASTSS